MRLIITGGGTGGHVYPGIAVALELMRRDSNSEALFVGASRGVERELVPKAGLKLALLNVSGLRGEGIAGKISGIARLVKAIFECIGIIRRFKPDVTLGVGGYASGAMGVASVLTGVPLTLAEQNSAPGLTNRWLSRVSKRVFVTWPGSEEFFPNGRARITGNPIRPEFFSAPPEEKSDTLKILVIGGSGGARSINNAMVEAIQKLDETGIKLSVTHQTGKTEASDVKGAYSSARFSWEVAPFFYDLPLRMADADLIVSRAGAGALAEICAVGKAAIYVPYPYAADDHQMKNAEKMMSVGAALVVADSDLDGDFLVKTILELACDRNSLARMGEKAKAMATPDSAGLIVDELYAITRKVA